MPNYPQADRTPVVDQLHGHAIADPYRWLEDAWSPRTRAWQASQDELWHQHTAQLIGRERLQTRIAELSAVGLVTPPMWRGGRRFFLRRTSRQDHPILYAASPDGTEWPLVDPNALDPSGRTVLDSWQPSPDGRLLAYQLSRGGGEQSELSVLDVVTQRLVDGPLDRCRYSPVAWLPDGKAFYYVRSGQVRRHQVGGSDDEPLLSATASYGLDISRDGRWLTISAGPDVWLADLADGPRLAVLRRDTDARTAVAVGPDGRMYLATTQGAPTGRICVGDPTRPDRWDELVPADPEAPLTDLVVLPGLLLVGRTRHTIGEIAIHDPRTGARRGSVPMPGLGSIGGLTTDHDRRVWFSYTDSVTPPTVYRYDADTEQTRLWANPPGSAGLGCVVARQIGYRSADGTTVRMLALSRGGSSGPRPTILYGYGGFGTALTPSYSSFALAWVEAGGVFVTANLRGGGEYGADWHRAGMLADKQKVFDDFIAAAERLIADGWTTPNQLGICGESNGGLLVGAALTQRPDLFGAAVCSAPVLDMIRYHRFGLGPHWVAEYGSADDPDQLPWLLDYSPYHRVRTGVGYPAVLFTVFGNDTRVDPMHARKMCAALQHASTGSGPILLRHEPDRGHGPTSVSRGVALAADILSFFTTHLGPPR